MRAKSIPATALGAIALLAMVPLLSSCTKYGGSLTRPEEPVVLQGSALPKLAGADPMRVVGFAWDGQAWKQVPVQVDQRDFVNPGQIKNQATSQWPTLPDGSPFEILVYTAPTAASPGYRWWDTFTPPDRNPTLDANDEVAFLADDTGQAAPADAGNPAGVVASTRQAVRVDDPIASGQFGYLYLFRSTTLTGGGAGTTGVNYTYSLDSGDYRATFNTSHGPNPEHSTVDAPGYSLAFGDRWLNDGLGVKAGGAANQNQLERSRFQLVPGQCGRSEDTFDAGPGAAVANVSGPVRAVRSVMGANSGAYTVLTDFLYPQREDSVVELRLHTIAGVMSFDDMRTGVPGLTYRDDTTAGVPIDGNPDGVDAAVQRWSEVSGNGGSLVTTRQIQTDVPGIEVSTYYKDQSPADPVPCTGDAAAWGQNGGQVTGPGGGPISCTDPTRYGNPQRSCPAVVGRDQPYRFEALRHRFFERPNLPAEDAATLATHTEQPLQATVT